MSLTGSSSVLVPVDISGDEQPAQPLIDLCRSVDIVLLGYYPVPDQVAPAQLKEDHESDATAALADVAEKFRDSGIDVTDVLVFTHDRIETMDRVANEHGCDAVLTVGTGERIERVLVPVRGGTNLERIVLLLADVMRMSDVSVTFLHSAVDDEPDNGELLVRGAMDRLSEAGVDRERIDWQLADEDSPFDEIIELAQEYGLLVLGETKPSLRERIFGTVPSRVVDEVDKPAFIVRDIG
ncbi:MAG: nucleotide-binding universal stress UspA family protein [Natronomonas sp.]|jgi:nucleotide-binding universal stress UspA family protein